MTSPEHTPIGKVVSLTGTVTAEGPGGSRILTEDSPVFEKEVLVSDTIYGIVDYANDTVNGNCEKYSDSNGFQGSEGEITGTRFVFYHDTGERAYELYYDANSNDNETFIADILGMDIESGDIEIVT